MLYTRKTYQDFLKATEAFVKNSPAMWASFTPAIRAIFSDELKGIVGELTEECTIHVHINVLDSPEKADITLNYKGIEYSFSITRHNSFGTITEAYGTVIRINKQESLLAMLVGLKK